jgi:glycosyltransferase involved in cell wall biosynthesis
MNPSVEHRFLLNFAASPIGGGFKRLYEYARWFNGHGGAWFIVHPQRASLAEEFPKNGYFVARQSVVQRLVDDAAYLPDVLRQTGTPDCYYSYGIPIPRRCGHLNWFHLSNVLPLGLAGIPSPLKFRIKFGILGWKIRRRLHLADIISAESRNSLRLMGAAEDTRHVVSVNGSDDELRYLNDGRSETKENIATVVGTYWYKSLEDSYHVFDVLRRRSPGLTLVVIGDNTPQARAHGMIIPDVLRGQPDVRLAGALPRTEVMQHLRRSRYYISTTRVENSWNAASEGAFFADESYLSDLGPHRELLEGTPFTEEAVPRVGRPLLHVRREQMSGANLKTWDTVVADMIVRMTAGKAR